MLPGPAFEIKFVIDPPTADEIIEWARVRLAPDPHGGGQAGDEYLTRSVYFDTEDFDVFHRRGSFGRSKYRARVYGDGDRVFLERKIRRADRVSKRRTTVLRTELNRLNGSGPVPGWSGDWFHKRLQLRRLDPVCQVAYRRTARVASTDAGPVRLTADREIRVLRANDLAFVEGNGVPIVESAVLLEVKFRAAMPPLFQQLVNDFKLESVRISKYRLGISALYGLVAARDVEAPLEAKSPADA